MSLALILSLISGVVPLFQKYLGSNLDSLIQTGITALSQLLRVGSRGSQSRTF